MSRELYDLLTEAPFWQQRASENDFADFSDADLARMLAEYRTSALQIPVESPRGDLGLCVGADQELVPDDSLLKRAVAYFDRIVVPDPLFRLGARCGSDTPLPRTEIAAACRHLRHLTPLVRTGHIKVAPTSFAFEPPEEVPVTYSESLYRERVPNALHPWFLKNANVRKVVTDHLGRRLVLRAAPDVDTTTIHVDFGQRGRAYGYDYMHVVDVDDDGAMHAVAAFPPSPQHLARWIDQSVNQSASDFLSRVTRDASLADQLGCFYMTSCAATAELLALHAPPDQSSAFPASVALELELPALESASLAQIAELLERSPNAFASFRTEVRDGLATIGEEMDHDELRSTLGKLQGRLARDQVRAVEAEMRKVKSDLRWDIPIAIGKVSLGVFAAAKGAFPVAISLLHGGIEGLQVLRRTMGHRNLPGYFLWRLQRGR